MSRNGFCYYEVTILFLPRQPIVDCVARYSFVDSVFLIRFYIIIILRIIEILQPDGIKILIYFRVLFRFQLLFEFGRYI